MAQTVLLGDPASFRIQAGLNPHTRDRWGRLKRVHGPIARAQWEKLKLTLEGHGVRVELLPAVAEQPGTVFPANAGFRFGKSFYLSRLNPARAGELPHYRAFLQGLGLEVRDLPAEHPFEGEADFIPVGHPSGDPSKELYLFTHGRVFPPRRRVRLGWPPVRWSFGFRSDLKARRALEGIVHPREVVPLELSDPAYYHGDTVLCPFGPHREFLLAYLAGLTSAAQTTLRYRFGSRLVLLSEEDACRFAANSFQVKRSYFGETVCVLLMPDGLGQSLYAEIRGRGVIPCPVDVSEFLEKGGGAVKCMLLDLGELAG